MTSSQAWKFPRPRPWRRPPISYFKREFLQVFVEGLKDRPDTTYGTVNADVLEHFVPGFRRTSMVERVTNAPWPN